MYVVVAMPFVVLFFVFVLRFIGLCVLNIMFVVLFAPETLHQNPTPSAYNLKHKT